MVSRCSCSCVLALMSFDLACFSCVGCCRCLHSDVDLREAFRVFDLSCFAFVSFVFSILFCFDAVGFYLLFVKHMFGYCDVACALGGIVDCGQR